MSQAFADSAHRLLRFAMLATIVGCAEADPCDPLPTHGECSPLRDHDETKRCLSNDPAAVGGRLPRYPGVDASSSSLGEPLFSLERNDWSLFGGCAFKDIDTRATHAACNPTWDSATIELVCGTIGCRQDDAVVEADCVLVEGVWRAVRGSDMQTPEDWVVAEPGTRQDPQLEGCTDWATDAAGVVDRAKLLDCVHQLTAADQRGFCIDMLGLLPPPDVCADMN